MEQNLGNQNRQVEDNIPSHTGGRPKKWLNEHKRTRHFLVEFFVVVFSNLTNFFNKKDQQIEEEEGIKNSVIKHD